MGVLMGPSYPARGASGASDRMPRTPKEVTLPNLKVYRAAWVVALILVVISLFTLGQPRHPQAQPRAGVVRRRRRRRPTSRTIVKDFPQRVAGTDPDNRMALWVVQQFKRRPASRRTSTASRRRSTARTSPCRTSGRSPRGDTPGTILVIANRDVPPLGHAGRQRQRLRRRGAARAGARLHGDRARPHHRLPLHRAATRYGALGAHGSRGSRRSTICTPSSRFARSRRATPPASASTAGARRPRWRRPGCGCSRRRRPA